MRASQFFLPVIKENPSEAQIASHRLMLRAGMIRQLTSGIYNWLPLGLRVLRNIEAIVRDELNKAGCQEILMPTIQPAELWQESGRYEDYGKEMLRITDRHDRAMLYGPTNEEVVTDIFRQNVKSYKQLPMQLYHIQWKFRDEIRPRFGVMRGREFLMKDAYSFDIDHESAVKSYNLYFRAYLAIFKRLGLTAIPMKADTGPIGGDMSHEFHIVADTGESAIYYDKAFDSPHEMDIEEMKQLYAAADEMHDPATCPVAKENLREARGIEVGHIFNFGTKYSEMLGAKVANANGEEVFAQMGSYGVGVSRLVGGIIEASHDDAGIIWPESVAPFHVALVNIKPGDAACDEACEEMYRKLQSQGVEVLYEDSDQRAGAKFATMELIGIPWVVTVGPRGIANGMVELKHRTSGEKQELSAESALLKLLHA